MSKRDLLVYVAGPFRSPYGFHGIVQNIRRAEAVALELWLAGYTAVCPHLNTANFQDSLPDDVWLDGDLRILERCDAVFLVPGWESSSGTNAEIRHAKEIGIPVFADLDKINEWAKEASKKEKTKTQGDS